MRILIDCTASHWRPHNRTGIQRVVREICSAASDVAPPGAECIPVQWSLGAWRLAFPRKPTDAYVRLRELVKRVQRRRTDLGDDVGRGRWPAVPGLVLFALAYGLLRLLAQVQGYADALRSPRVCPRPGDTLFLAEYPYRNQGAIVRAHGRGIRIVGIIYDIIPITHPQVVSRQAQASAWFDWLGHNCARLISISSAVAGQLRERYRRAGPDVAFFHLGADFDHGSQACPPGGLPDLYFLMVGTLAPHKRHGDALAAFELLWAAGSRAALVILGRPGWLTSELVSRIRSHPEFGRRLRWLDDSGDAELAFAYGNAHALIAASEVEGFGLPLVEALVRGVPVIASDIPVFREVAGDWADYFEMGNPRSLAERVGFSASRPRRDVSGFRWHSWDEAAHRVLQLVSAP